MIFILTFPVFINGLKTVVTGKIFRNNLVYSITNIVGDSMNPTILDGQKGFSFNLLQDEINRFDIVIVKVDNHEQQYIKRVIGLPGDTLIFENGNVLIMDSNNRHHNDPFDQDNTFSSLYYEIKLQDNQYFVMGDNRTDSLDSRDFGAISEKEIINKVNKIY